MNLVNWQKKLGIWQSWLLVGMIFSLPFRNDIVTNFLLLFILIFWIVEANFRHKWQEIKAHPLFFPVLAYAALYPISLMWTENTVWAMKLIEQYHVIYWFFPLFITVARKEHLPHYLAAFISAMTVSEVASYSVWFNWISIPNVHPDDPAGFLGHFEYNPFLAFAVYIMGYGLLFQKISGIKKWLYLLFIITMTINMFITGGRIGQLTYFALVLLLSMQFFYQTRYFLHGLLSSVVALIVVFAVAYHTSPIFNTRVNAAIYEISHHDNTQTGSVNSRFIMWEKSLALFLTQPILGSGVGDYPDDYNRLVGDSIPETAKMSIYYNLEHNKVERMGLIHAHNQYIYDLASFGLVGFFILIWMLWVMGSYAITVKDQWKPIRIGFVFLTLFINLTDCYFLLISFSYLFVILLAIFWSADKAKYQ